MEYRIGTIDEVTGRGYEILVDRETREQVLGVFYDGNMVCEGDPAPAGELSLELTKLLA